LPSSPHIFVLDYKNYGGGQFIPYWIGDLNC